VHGAEVVLEGDTLADAGKHARERQAREQLTFIHPYDDAAIVAGTGTVALEMLEQAPVLDTLVIPVGGGGLIAGMALAARALKPSIEIYGVESKLWCAVYQHLNSLPVQVGGDTIAEGMAVRDSGELPLRLIRENVKEVLLVDEETIERAVVALIEIEKTVAEGAGAAGLAALLEHPKRFAGRTVGIPICGGNIDSRVLSAILMRGLVRDGRLARLRVVLPDIAGSLAKVAAMIGEAGGNIMEVQHQRVFGTASVRSPEVEFTIEARDRPHLEAIIAALAAKGVRAAPPE
jgi:threonine dehydratase